MKNYPIQRLKLLLFFVSNSFLIQLSAQIQTPRYISMCSNVSGFYEYLPQGYGSGTETYPVIIFLHGIGESGNGSIYQLGKILNTGLPALIQQGKFPVSFTVNSKTYKFIVISPQFLQWPKPAQVDSVINYVVKNYRANTKKIYVTGLSMGGGATWEYVGNTALYNKRIAAIVPIAGASWPDVGRSNIIADALLPVWATHNDGDPTVPVSYTNLYTQNILARNPKAPVKKTIFSGTSHDAWTKTYDPAFKESSKNIYEWMLQYETRNGQSTNQIPVSNAGADASITLPTSSVLLNGKTSYDPDGTIASYWWTKDSGPDQFKFNNVNSNNPTVSNLVAGQYVFRLKTTDNGGAFAYDYVTVTVLSALMPGTKLINVNVYNGAVPYNNTQWNNWNFGTTSTVNLSSGNFKYSDGTSSSAVGKISNSGTVVDNGATYSSGMAPAEVLRYTSYFTSSRTLTISGLSTSLKYSIELYASRNLNPTSSTLFKINGASQTIATYNNQSKKALFSNLTPNAQGQIVVSVDYVGTYNYLNGFSITEINSALGARPENLITSVPEKTSVSIFPNPVEKKFELVLKNKFKGIFTVQIVNAAGAIVQQFQSNKEGTDFTETYFLSGKLKSGYYNIQVVQGGNIQRLKIIKL